MLSKTIALQRKLKLIWDFRGSDALEMAKHHCIHLTEFAEKEDLSFYKADHHSYSDVYTIAYIIIDETQMVTYRDALKPHRGEVA